MFLGAPPNIFERAKELRANETVSEKILWEYLKQKPMGYKFRRQHPIQLYVVDFYCHALKIVIEVDGTINDKIEIKENDIERQKYLEDNGLKFLRFTNMEIETDLEDVKQKIEDFIRFCESSQK